MITRRRVLGTTAGIGAAAVGAGVLTGCGQDEPAEGAVVPSEPTEVKGKVTHWVYPIGDTAEQSWWDELVADFNKEYPDVDVAVVVQPWKGRAESLTTAVTSKTAPDVVYFNPDYIPRFAVDDLLTPVEGILEAERDDYVDAAIEAVTFEGKVYGIPMLMEAFTPGYNAAVLDQLGFEEPPLTWDDLRTVGDAAVAKGMTLTDYAAADGTLNGTFYPFLWQAGGEVLTEDGTAVAFDGPEGLEALTFLRELADAGALNKDVLQQPAPVFEQSAIARDQQAISLGMVVTDAQAVMGDKAQAAAPFQGKEQALFGSVGALSLFSTAKDPEAVAAWVAWISNKENTERFLKASGYLPPRVSLADVWADDPIRTFQSQFLDRIRVGVLHPKSRELMDVIRPHLQACLLGQAEPEAALAAAAEEANAMLSR
jgi:multiple sugar transport system substrate-binding protein